MRTKSLHIDIGGTLHLLCYAFYGMESRDCAEDMALSDEVFNVKHRKRAEGFIVDRCNRQRVM